MSDSLDGLSERARLAQAIAEFVLDQRFGGPYGGDVVKRGRFYSIGFSVNALLDGEVRVYGTKFIQVIARGRLALSAAGDSYVFDTEENAKRFIQAAYVAHDRETALAVPTDPSRGEQA